MSAIDQLLFDDAEVQDFDEPTPLFRETPPGEQFPIDALGELAHAVRGIMEKTQVPPALAAHSVLGVAGFAAQGLADVELLQGTAPLSLYLVTIAESGERKTAADKLAMQPVRAFQSELLDRYREELQSHKNDMDVYQAKRKKVFGRGGPAIEEAKEVLSTLGPEPEPPPLPVVLMTEPTIEGVLKHLNVSRPSVALLSDEGGMFVGGVGMNPDNRLKSVAGFSMLWNGTPFVRMRAGDGVTSIKGRRISMHVMLQEVAARVLLSDEIANNQGFNSRLLIAKPLSTIGTRLQIGGSQASDNQLNAYSSRIADILRRPLPLRPKTQNELEPRTLSLTDDARSSLREFYVEIERQQAPGQKFEDCKAFASKSAEHAARLAAVIAIYENADTEEVSAADITRGILLARFYLTEAIRLTDAAQTSVETMRAEQLRLWLLEKWSDPHISRADATQRGPCKDTAINSRSIEILVQHGWLVEVEGGAMIRGKRRREAWRIVRPTVVPLRGAERTATSTRSKVPKAPKAPRPSARNRERKQSERT